MPKVRRLLSRIEESELYYRIQKIEHLPKKIALVAMGIFLLFLPGLVSSYIVTISIFIMLYTLVGAGLFLLIGYGGVISLGQVGFFCIGAYLSAILAKDFHLSPWLGICGAAIANGIIAYILGRPFFKAGRMLAMTLAIITLAFAVIVFLAAGRLPFTGGHDGIAGIPPLSIGGLSFTDTHYYYLIWAVTGLGLLFTYNLTERKTGRGLRSLSEFTGGDEIAAITSGIDSVKLKLQFFVICAVYASVAGSLFAHWLTVITPDFFNIMVTFTFVMIVGIGGFRSVWGPLIGSAFYFGLKEILSHLMRGLQVFGMEIVVFGVMFILVLIFLPGGITSLPDELREWWHEWQLKSGRKKIITYAEWLDLKK